MARVKTFRIINDIMGMPDQDIRDFISSCEKEMIVSVTTVYIPGSGKIDPRLTVIVTKLDDLPVQEEQMNGTYPS